MQKKTKRKPRLIAVRAGVAQAMRWMRKSLSVRASLGRVEPLSLTALASLSVQSRDEV